MQTATDLQYPTQEPTKLVIKFSVEGTKDEEASVEAGRPIFKDEEYITIRVPGQTDFICRPVRPSDKQEYAQQYAAFKLNQEQGVVGTRLDALPFLTKAQVMELQAAGFQTAEQVRDMSDTIGQRFAGSHTLRKKIGDFLSAAAGNAPLEKMRAELDKRDNEIATMKRMIEEMGKRLDAKK
jgi:hypothetical protein